MGCDYFPPFDFGYRCGSAFEKLQSEIENDKIKILYNCMIIQERHENFEEAHRIQQIIIDNISLESILK